MRLKVTTDVSSRARNVGQSSWPSPEQEAIRTAAGGMRECGEAEQTAASVLKNGHCRSLFVMAGRMVVAGKSGASRP